MTTTEAEDIIKNFFDKLARGSWLLMSTEEIDNLQAATELIYEKEGKTVFTDGFGVSINEKKA